MFPLPQKKPQAQGPGLGWGENLVGAPSSTCDTILVGGIHGRNRVKRKRISAGSWWKFHP